MESSPTWLYLLVVAAFVIDDTGLFVWLTHHDDCPERQAMLISTFGAIAGLFGQAGVHVTYPTGGWMNDAAWLFEFAGHALILIGIGGVLRIEWKRRRQRRLPITDPYEYYRSKQVGFACIAGPLSLFLATTTLHPKHGVIMAVLLLLISIIVPPAFRMAPQHPPR